VAQGARGARGGLAYFRLIASKALIFGSVLVLYLPWQLSLLSYDIHYPQLLHHIHPPPPFKYHHHPPKITTPKSAPTPSTIPPPPEDCLQHHPPIILPSISTRSTHLQIQKQNHTLYRISTSMSNTVTSYSHSHSHSHSLVLGRYSGCDECGGLEYERSFSWLGEDGG